MAKNFLKTPFATGTVKKYRGAGGLNKTRKPKNSVPSGVKVSEAPAKRTPREQAYHDLTKRLVKVHEKVNRHLDKGVKLSGTRFDPIRRKPIAAMSTAEMRVYKAELDQFMHRSKQYEADAFGNPIPAAAMREYKMYERKYNKHIERELKKISGIKLPHMDMTLGQRMEKVVGASKYNNITNGMNRLSQLNRNSSAFFSADSVGKAIATMRKKLSRTHKSRTVEANRNSWAALVEYANRDTLLKISNMLTDEEFQTLADYSPLFSEANSNYTQWKRMQSNTQNATEFQAEVNELYDMIEDQMKYIIAQRGK